MHTNNQIAKHQAFRFLSATVNYHNRLSNHVHGSLGLVPHQTLIVLHWCWLVDQLISRTFSGTPNRLLTVVIRTFRHGYTMLRLQCVSSALTMTKEAVVFLTTDMLSYNGSQFWLWKRGVISVDKIQWQIWKHLINFWLSISEFNEK